MKLGSVSSALADTAKAMQPAELRRQRDMARMPGEPHPRAAENAPGFSASRSACGAIASSRAWPPAPLSASGPQPRPHWAEQWIAYPPFVVNGQSSNTGP
ncbi:hypothetical protein GQ53DRAFT_166640 [Thozetella sp. PMI_491]|nr:hypothetical protein GQ53DRAFT_166640 [Thozetella sp. PMI_491]